jgi:hypothetical protein
MLGDVGGMHLVMIQIPSDIKSHLRTLPLQLPQQITFDQWQQGDKVFTHAFQRTKDDPAPCFPDDFRSYLEDFDDCSSEHLDLFCEDDCQSPIWSDFDTSKDIVCLKKGSHGFSLQPSVVTLPCLSIKGVLGKYIFNVEFPLGKTLNSKGWLGTVCFSQIFNSPFLVCQSSARSLSIPSLISGREDVLGNQSVGLLGQLSKPCIFHDPFLKWIEYFPRRWTWQDFTPPTRLHELDSDLLSPISRDN